MSIGARRLQRTKQAMGGNPGSGGGELDLPRVPWEGGSAYWEQFPQAHAYGWSDPSFFPIGIFPTTFSDASEVQWDKDHGINFYYEGLNEWSPWDLLQPAGMSWVGWQYTANQGGTMPANYPAWVGHGLGDEIDGLYENPQQGLSVLDDIVANLPNDGRFKATNYTQRTLRSNWTQWGERFINDYTDTVSLDMYWYTIPDSSYGGSYVPGVNVNGAHARAASGYGAMIRGMRYHDQADSKLQPLWMYIENLSGGPGEEFVRYIEPHEIKAAVMSVIANEGRGILWFNSAMSAPDQPNRWPIGNVLRYAQVTPGFWGHPQVAAMSEINWFVRSLAPVINTQSYVWDFGASSLDTMLKTHEGYAYIFASVGTQHVMGSKTFQLPPGITGTSVEVIGESRNLSVNGSKQFTDTFPQEYTWHVYRVAI